LIAWASEEVNSSLAGTIESNYAVLGCVSSPLWLCGFWMCVCEAAILLLRCGSGAGGLGPAE
jgi:hypothetical protein